MKTDRKTGLRVFMKHLGGVKDNEVLEKSYDVSIIDDKFSRNQYPSFEGINAVLDSLGDRAKDAPPAAFVDLRFVKKLEEHDFINTLYKR